MKKKRMRSLYKEFYLFVIYFLIMEGEGPPAELKQISIWDKFKSNTLKSIRISYMNWTYLPRWNGEEETAVDKLFRYSHFPMATQVFTYFAYRAACQVLVILIC